MNVNIIVAVDSKTGGIGINGEMPWKCKEDLKWFKEVTLNNCVIMGSNTFKSIIAQNGSPLKDRVNFVLSSKSKEEIENAVKNDVNIYNSNKSNFSDNFDVFSSLENALKEAEERGIENVFIIGGGSVYKEAIEKDLVDAIYIDWIDTNLTHFDFDTFFDISIFTKSDGNNDNSIERWKKSDVIIYNSNKSNFSDNFKCNFKHDNIVKNIHPEVWYRHRYDNEIDHDYLKLLSDIINSGKTKNTRSGETLSLFGRMLTFDVSKNNIAALTTKKMYFNGCIYELLWFLRGDTNIKYLIENKCNIWTDDAYRYYLEKFDDVKKPTITKEQFVNRVLKGDVIHWVDKSPDNSHKVYTHYTYGDLGNIYGKQWTNWNNINQIENVINKLQENPNDRRLIVSAWNVSEIDEMALPPCHYCMQFYTEEISREERIKLYNIYYSNKSNFNTNLDAELGAELDAELDAKMDDANVPKYYLSVLWSQRSVDTCLGLPYNMLSYSMLLYIIATKVNMLPKEVKCSLGDVHVYKNQIGEAKKQLLRNPYKYDSPNLLISNSHENVKDYERDDFEILNYNSYDTIKYPLSVGL